ncbi:MAG: YbjQ family protein [Desulfosalsimonadaceae bacterium]
MENMLITTTPMLDGYRIVRYIGPVVVPIVGAGNMIKDWFAGFTDVFGGNSSCYQKVFARFINNGVKEMMAQAEECGANAILGFHIETTNISAGKSIISIILYGTAAIVEVQHE